MFIRSSRGQTQSQYLNFGKPEEDGKAEAEATENGSRSTVCEYGSDEIH